MQEGVGRWRQPRTTSGPQVGPKSRINSDVAREMAQTKVCRFEKALEAMGDLQGPIVDALRTDLSKARAAAKKPSVDVEIDECRKFITRAERRIKELEAEREKEHNSLIEAEERLKRLMHEQSLCAPVHEVCPESGAQVTSLQQMVNLLEAERDVLAKELQSFPKLCRMMSEGSSHLLEMFPDQPSSGANMVLT